MQEKVDVERSTKWTYAVMEAVYESPGDAAPQEVKRLEQAEAEPRHESARAALQSFLERAGWNAERDGKIFYAPQDGVVYVGFQRVEADGKAHEHLALLYRVEVEVRVFDATLAEVEALFGGEEGAE